MSYLNPPYENNFKELCASMPLFYLDVAEMRAILKAQGRLLDGVCDSFERVIDDNFILRASEETIAVYEAFLQITPEAGLSLDERRKIVIATMYRTPHFGEPEIKELFSIFNKGRVTVGFSKGVIGLVVYPLETECLNTDAFITAVSRQKPAHLSLALIFGFSYAIKIGVRIDKWLYRLPECGTIRCGEHWTRKQLGWTEYRTITTKDSSSAFIVFPELTGTLPVDKELGWSVLSELRTGESTDGFIILPKEAGEVLTGTEWTRKQLGFSEKGTLLNQSDAGIFAVSPELTGTLPETAETGYALEAGLYSAGGMDNYCVAPPEAGKVLSGTEWTRKQLGYTERDGVLAAGQANGFEITPPETGDTSSGTEWTTKAVGYSAGADMTAAGSADGYNIAPELAGTLPETSELGQTVTGEVSAGSSTDGLLASPELTGTLPETQE